MEINVVFTIADLNSSLLVKTELKEKILTTSSSEIKCFFSPSNDFIMI